MLRIQARSMDWFKRFSPAPKRYQQIVARYGVRELEILWDAHTQHYVLVYRTPAMVETEEGGLWKEATIPQPVWVIEDEHGHYIEPGEWLLDRIAQIDALRQGKDALKAQLHEQDRQKDASQARDSANTLEALAKEIAPDVRRALSEELGTVTRKQGKGPMWGGTTYYPEAGPIGSEQPSTFRGTVGAWDLNGRRIDAA